MPVDKMVAGTLTKTARITEARPGMLSGYVPKNRKYLNGIKLASIWPALPRDVWIASTVFVPPDGSWCV